MKQLTHAKVEKNILIAFILNLSFAIFEFFGGFITGSIAISSDAIHDLGDAVAIGASYLLEKKSRQRANSEYTYGYARYSVLGAAISTLVVVVGSAVILITSFGRIFQPVKINFDGMLTFAVLGIVINGIAAYRTSGKGSLNQKSVNLHMLEDVLGWVVIFTGSIVMRFTHWSIIDPLMSIGMALFILYQGGKNFRSILDLFLEKTPSGLSASSVKRVVKSLKNVESVHHIHIWGLDETHSYATMHVVLQKGARNKDELKDEIREYLAKQHISHVTIEFETSGDPCGDQNCHPETIQPKDNLAEQ